MIVLLRGIFRLRQGRFDRLSDHILGDRNTLVTELVEVTMG